MWASVVLVFLVALGMGAVVAGQVELWRRGRRLERERHRYDAWIPWQETIVVQNDQREFNARINAAMRAIDAAGGVLKDPHVLTMPLPLERDSLTGEVTMTLILQATIPALLPSDSPYLLGRGAEDLPPPSW